MYSIDYTHQFKKDLRKCAKRGLDIEAIKKVITILSETGTLPKEYLPHQLKVNDTAENALKQIDDKGYAIPYQADGRRVVKVGVSVDADTRTIKDWNVAY